MSAVYEINKGINRSIEFRGIKAQYITYLAAGLVALLILFLLLYIIGISIYLCLSIVLPAGAGLVISVQRYSKKYGEHGLLKKAAKNRLPAYVKSTSRKIFIRLSEKRYEEDKKTGRTPANI